MVLYPVNQLYESAPEVESTSSTARNPLSFAGALDEAEFVEMRLSPQRSRAGIICDIRSCSGFEGANTAVVVLIGIGNIAWSNDNRTRQLPWYARYGDWMPRLSSRTEEPSPPWISGRADVWATETLDNPTQAVASFPTPDEEIDNASDYVLNFGKLTVSALTAHIYIGHVDGLDDAPPNMGELSDAEIIAGFPQWSSVMAVHEHHTYPGAQS